MTGRRRRRCWAGASMVAVVVLAACTGGDDDEPAADRSTTTTSAGAGGAATEGWVRSTSEALRTGRPAATLSGLLPPAGGDGWVLAGTSFDEEGRPRATVWRSDDALEWTSSQAAGRGRSEAFAAVRHGGALVVVGRERVGDGSRAAVWRGEGGRFTPVDGGDAFAGAERVTMTEVVALGDGLVAAGTRAQEGSDDAVALWRSPDGRAWDPMPAAEAVFAAGGRAAVHGLLAVPGGVVAVGRVTRAGDTDAAAWFSADGVMWTPAAASGGFTGPGPQAVNDVVVVDGGLLAVGSTNDGRLSAAAVWRSADGRSWAPATATFERRGTSSDTFGATVYGVVKGPGGLVAAGRAASPRMWASADGTTWSELDLPEETQDAERIDLVLLESSGDDVLAVSVRDGVPLVLLRRDGTWVDVTAGSPAFPAPLPELCCVTLSRAGDRVAAGVTAASTGKALGNERNDVRMYLSTDDGLTWKGLARAPFTHARLGAMVAHGDGAVAVGAKPFDLSPDDRTPTAFLVWESDDGSAWRRLDFGLPGVPPDGATKRLEAVVARGDRLVAAGSAYNGTDTDGIVFVRDGTGRFRLVEGVPGFEGPEDVNVAAACAGPRGFVVAGSVRAGTELEGAVWFSPDGDAWQRVTGPAFSGPGVQHVEACAATGGGFLAAGGVAAGDALDAAVWSSPDGLAWARVESPAFGGDDGQFAEELAVDGDEVLAVGNDERGGEGEIVLWRSSDGGATWARVPLGPAFLGQRYQVATSVLVTGDRVVVGGVVDDAVAIWSAPWPLPVTASD